MNPVIERLLKLVDECELNEKQLLRKLDISNASTITDWRTGKSQSPSIKNVIKFAKFFNVSTDYLLLGENTLTKLTEAENEWLNMYQQLSVNERKECVAFMKGYIAKGDFIE